MADEPDVGAKLLVGMVKTYTDEKEADSENSTLNIGDIRSFIKEVDKDWWEDDDTMRKTLDQLGAGADQDGPNTYYARFRDLAPATLDKIRDIAD